MEHRATCQRVIHEVLRNTEEVKKKRGGKIVQLHEKYMCPLLKNWNYTQAAHYFWNYLKLVLLVYPIYIYIDDIAY